MGDSGGTRAGPGRDPGGTRAGPGRDPGGTRTHTGAGPPPDGTRRRPCMLLVRHAATSPRREWLTGALRTAHRARNGVSDRPQVPLCGRNGVRTRAPRRAAMAWPGPTRPVRGRKGDAVHASRAAPAPSKAHKSGTEPRPVLSAPRAAPRRTPRMPYCTRRSPDGGHGATFKRFSYGQW